MSTGNRRHNFADRDALDPSTTWSARSRETRVTTLIASCYETFWEPEGTCGKGKMVEQISTNSKIDKYHRLARNEGANALITVSNQPARPDGTPPLTRDRRRNIPVSVLPVDLFR